MTQTLIQEKTLEDPDSMEDNVLERFPRPLHKEEETSKECTNVIEISADRLHKSADSSVDITSADVPRRSARQQQKAREKSTRPLQMSPAPPMNTLGYNKTASAPSNNITARRRSYSNLIHSDSTEEVDHFFLV